MEGNINGCGTMIACDELPDNLRQICTGEADIPLRKINAYRKTWGLGPLQLEGKPTHFIHDGKADIPIPVHRPRKSIYPPARGKCGSCVTAENPKKKPVVVLGVGGELLQIFTAAGVPHCQACRDMAAKMDDWGPLGCVERLQEIVDDVLPRAQKWVAAKHPWADKLFPAIVKDYEISRRIRSYVMQAVAVLERKQHLRETVFQPLRRVPVCNINDVVEQCTVIVKSFQRFDCLGRFLTSLWKHYPGIYVIVADDSLRLGEEYPQKVSEIQQNPAITWLQLPFDSGLSHGRNEAVKLAQTPCVVLCDDDYVVNEKTRLERMLAVLWERPRISLVGGLVEEEGRTKNWVGKYLIRNRKLTVSKLSPKHSIAGGVKYRETNVCWNFFVARTDSLLRVPWDPELKIAAEHVDFFISRFRSGERSAYTPESCVEHRKSRHPEYTAFRDRREHFQSLMRKRQCLDSVGSLSPTREEWEQ
jgi:hypothetical protein